MRRPLIIMGLLIIVTCMPSHATSSNNARTKTDVVGPVRTIVTKGGTTGFSEAEIYDRAGNLTETVIYQPDETVLTRYLFSYDQQGALQETRAYDGHGTMLYRKLFAYNYDSRGHVAAIVASSQEGEFQHAEFSLYDERGFLAEKLHVNAMGIYRNIFDVQGHLLYSAWYRNGQLEGEIKSSYDLSGRLVALLSYGPLGALVGKSTNEYDESGRRIRNITEKFQQGEDGKWITEYEYDSAGNWITERMATRPGVSSESAAGPYHVVQERVIEYYDTP